MRTRAFWILLLSLCLTVSLEAAPDSPAPVADEYFLAFFAVPGTSAAADGSSTWILSDAGSRLPDATELRVAWLRRSPRLHAEGEVWIAREILSSRRVQYNHGSGRFQTEISAPDAGTQRLPVGLALQVTIDARQRPAVEQALRDVRDRLRFLLPMGESPPAVWKEWQEAWQAALKELRERETRAGEFHAWYKAWLERAGTTEELAVELERWNLEAGAWRARLEAGRSRAVMPALQDRMFAHAGDWLGVLDRIGHSALRAETPQALRESAADFSPAAAAAGVDWMRAGALYWLYRLQTNVVEEPLQTADGGWVDEHPWTAELAAAWRALQPELGGEWAAHCRELVVRIPEADEQHGPVRARLRQFLQSWGERGIISRNLQACAEALAGVQRADALSRPDVADTILAAQAARIALRDAIEAAVASLQLPSLPLEGK